MILKLQELARILFPRTIKVYPNDRRTCLPTAAALKDIDYDYLGLYFDPNDSITERYFYRVYQDMKKRIWYVADEEIFCLSISAVTLKELPKPLYRYLKCK